MKIKELLFLLWAVVVVATTNYVISLVGFPLWLGVTLYALSFVVAFMVSMVAELVGKGKRHRRKVKRLLDADKEKIVPRNHELDIALVKEQVESIRESLLNSIEYEEAIIAEKQQIVEGYKQLLKELEEVNDNEKNNKEDKTL